MSGAEVLIGMAVWGGVLTYKAHKKEKRNKALAEAADKRHKEQLEQQRLLRETEKAGFDLSKGNLVWFSRRFKHGSLNHWAMFTHSTKYELRLDGHESGQKLMTSRWRTNIVPWNAEKEQQELREFNERNKHIPLSGPNEEFYTCFIGYTTLSPDEVTSACESLKANFGDYNLVFNNCQDFLKKFAELIILPENRTRDYQWFSKNVETEYHKLQAIALDANMREHSDYALGVYASVVAYMGFLGLHNMAALQTLDIGGGVEQEAGDVAGGDDGGDLFDLF